MRRVGSVLAVLAMLALAGCDSGDPLPMLPPTPSSTPVFGSEEEALAAATDAYAAYLEMSNLISSEGGVDPERIAPFVTPEQLPDELAGFAYFSDSGIHSVGEAHVAQVVLQQYSEGPEGAEIVVYACVDVGGVIILNADGNDVTPKEREPIVALEVSMTTELGNLLIADSDQWSDSHLCS